MRKFKWLVIYDICNEKRLRRVAKLMESYAVRVQKSVFEMVAKKNTVRRLRKKIRTIIDNEVDYVVYFQVCAKDWQKRQKYGPDNDVEFDDSPYQIL